MAEIRFTPKYPQKYGGDPRRIVARSSWELTYMQALDNSNLVSKWISEPKNLNIGYYYPVDKKIHQYWPDFLIVYTDGSIEIIEIKPMKETVLTSTSSLYDKLSWLKNRSKWASAERFAKSIGARFRVVTEVHLFGRKQKLNTYAPRRK